MIGKLTLESKLPDCQVGIPKDILVRVTPKVNDEDAGFDSDVEELPGYEEESEAGGEKKPYGSMPNAVVITIGNKLKGK